MIKKAIVLLFISLSICTTVFADDGLMKETYVYSLKDSDTLRLDRYFPGKEIVSEARPCIIFMFGGGFAAGTRDDKGYENYFAQLVRKGYNVVSIDYRLGMKNIGNNIDPMRFIALLNNSITIAVEDLFDATKFVVNHADEWNIRKDAIIANGSSAGAVAVLHGEYEICNKTKLTEKLPDGFNYAGTIAFAGAIFSTNGDLKWQNHPSPIQMFHGDADSNVPYDKIEMLRYGFYGSKHIAEQMNSMNTPYYFYKAENAAHEMAGKPMADNLNEIYTFIDELVLGNKQLMINTGVKEIGKPEMKKDFELQDYIRSNFGG